MKPADTSKETMLSRRVLRSTISNYVGKVVMLGTSFFLTPFILHQIGPIDFGLWALTTSIVGYGSLLDFGIGGAVIKYVAEYRAKGDMAGASRLVATALSLYTVLGLAAIALSFALAPIFPDLFNIPESERATATWLMLLSGISVGISIPATTTTAVLRGLQRFDLVSILSIVATLVAAISNVVMLLLGTGIVGMIAASLPLMCLMQIPSVILIRRIAPDLRLGWSGASRSLVRPVVSYSAAVFGINAGAQMQTKTGEIVIGAALPISFITPFTITRGLSDVARILTDQFVKVLLPLASELHAEKDTSTLRSLYTASTRLTLVVFAPIACALIILSPYLLSVWIGPAYASYGNLVLILTIGSLIDASQWAATSILQGMARHRLLAVMAIGTGIFNLVLAVALVGPLGLTGVALGALISSAVIAFGFILPYTLRVLAVRPSEAFRSMWVPAFLPVVPMAALLYAVTLAFSLTSLVWIGLAAVAGGLVYLAVYLGIGATSAEKQMYFNLIHGTLAFAAARLRRS
jgi:O-antigen/teichoic acid export membrane protein